MPRVITTRHHNVSQAAGTTTAPELFFAAADDLRSGMTVAPGTRTITRRDGRKAVLPAAREFYEFFQRTL
jgi:hypothetical protein